MFAGQDQREVLWVFDDQFVPAAEGLSPLLGRLLRPCGLGRCRRANGRSCLIHAKGRHCADKSTVKWIGDGYRLALGHRLPGAGKICLAGQKCRVVEGEVAHWLSGFGEPALVHELRFDIHGRLHA